MSKVKLKEQCFGEKKIGDHILPRLEPRVERVLERFHPHISASELDVCRAPPRRIYVVDFVGG